MDISRRYFKRMDLWTLTTFEAFQLMPHETRCIYGAACIKAIYRNYARFEHGRRRMQPPRSTACRSFGR